MFRGFGVYRVYGLGVEGLGLKKGPGFWGILPYGYNCSPELLGRADLDYLCLKPWCRGIQCPRVCRMAEHNQYNYRG